MDGTAEFTELQKKNWLHTENGLFGFPLLFWACFLLNFDWKIRLCTGDIGVP